MTNLDLPKQPERTATDEKLEQAIAHQQLGEFQLAGELYLQILQSDPGHAAANHQMGRLAIQMEQPAAALGYLSTALDAAPSHGPYWLDYIEALFLVGQIEDAQQVLALARQQGLAGAEVEALSARVHAPDAAPQQTAGTNAPHATPSAPASRPEHRGVRKGAAPDRQEIDTLIGLFTKGRLEEAAAAAQKLTTRYPHHEFGWKALGAVYKQMGRPGDALAPMEKAASLSPRDAEAHYNLGITLQELGKLEAAESSYARALRIDPNFASAHGNRGAVLHALGRLAEAKHSLERALKLKPDYAEAYSNLGIVLHAMGWLEEAQACYRNALRLKPDYATTHNNLGITLQGLGKLEEAEACYRHALALAPDYADAHYNLGNCLKASARPDEAATAYRQALQLRPQHADAHFNLGNLLQDSGHLEEADACYRETLKIRPDYAEALVNRGIVLSKLSRPQEAEASYQHALAHNPNNADAHLNLGNLMMEQEQPAEAETHYRQALKIRPDHPEANLNLGRTLFMRGRLNEAGVYFWRALDNRPDYAEAYCALGELLVSGNKLAEAEESLRHALRIKPDLASAHSMLGVALKEAGRLTEAEVSSRSALALKPNDATMLCGLANVLQEQGRLDEAEALFRQALQHQPDNAMIHNNLLFCISLSDKIDASALLADHLRFAEQFEPPLKLLWQPHDNPRIAERILQVGIVSGDFRNHAIANFIQPVLAHLANHPQLTLHAYANYPHEDETTKHLRGLFAHWHPVNALNDDELAQQIRTDGIDILIDLSGHTGYNRLLTFARKPAPVQVSWIGYPGTTGLRSIDYYLADRFLFPLGEFEELFTEKIVRLPATCTFSPHKDAPPVAPLPALHNGHITFGSFNRVNKMGRGLITMWSELLKAVPDSRMLLASMPQSGEHQTLVDWFAQEHISPERLAFYPRTDMPGYLSLHQKVDICLDTFPYNGGTTTFHALWMGVPTLTLAGNTVASRSGVSILGNVGLEEFVAHDSADFVKRGVFWSNNLSELSKMRAGLRERFSKSPSGDPALIATALERAMRIMWQRWCAGQAPEAFEVTSQDIKDLSPGKFK